MRSFDSSKLPETRMGQDFVYPKAPLDIEVGAGTGAFALDFSKTNPDRHLVSIEHTQVKFQKFQKSFEEAGGPQNLTPVHANAISWVSQQLKPESVEGFYFMYPNPNPKKKHLNKRWHAMPFLGRVIEVLKPGGQITMATNEKWYFDEALFYLQEVWKLSLTEELCFDQTSMPFTQARTLFEKKYLERGESCYQLRVHKQL